MRPTAAIASLLLACSATPGRAAAAPPDGALAPTATASSPPRRPARVPEPPIAIALTAGVATALIPLAIGISHTSTAPTDPSRNAGYFVAGAGFALAPIVAHAALGEWGRAAAFGAGPVACEIGLVALASALPGAIFHETQLSRTTFGVLFTADVFGAALGLVDVMLAGGRAREAALGGLTILPNLGRDHGGIVLGGTL